MPLHRQSGISKNHRWFEEGSSFVYRAYMNDFTNVNRQTLLHYLALCRNGLFKELLAHFEPSHSEQLSTELIEMESLPFIKVREVSGKRTYFLHDAMYTVCDEVLLKPGPVATDSLADRRMVRSADRNRNRSRSESRSSGKLAVLPYAPTQTMDINGTCNRQTGPSAVCRPAWICAWGMPWASSWPAQRLKKANLANP